MAETVLVLNKRNAAADTIETLYTAPSTGIGTRVTAFTASNDTITSHTFKAYIYGPGDTDPSAVIPQKIIVPDRENYGPSIVNQLIPPGGTLRVESSNADSLSFYVTGIEK